MIVRIIAAALWVLFVLLLSMAAIMPYGGARAHLTVWAVWFASGVLITSMFSY